MRILFAALILLGSARAEDPPACLPISQAKDHIGEQACIRGKVHRVRFTRGGTALLQFCEERECPFSIVVFSRDLEKVGNLQMFEGRVLEVTGTVRDYKGTPEIVVKKRSQFSGEAITPR